jgi:hypothetical protein
LKYVTAIATFLSASLFVGCEGVREKEEAVASAKVPESVAPPSRALPPDGRAFLAELAPLPGDVAPPGTGLRLSYRITGPAGSTGEMIVLLGVGGLRSESWSLDLPSIDGGKARRIEAWRTQGRSWVWSAEGGGPGEKYANPLESVASAYEARDEEARRRLVDTVRDWQGQLVDARREHPGEREEIEGISCLRMNLAGQVLCVWEETGLPLRHQGDSFSLELRTVQRGVELVEGSFDLPERAKEAKVVDVPKQWTLEGEAWLAELERGDPTALASVLTPGLRLPTTTELELETGTK